MTVSFVGAGPGAPDLLTLRGRIRLRRADVVLHAGSLVPPAVVALARRARRVVDTASLTLDEIVAEMVRAHRAGLEVVRLHSGDPSLYGAIAEQIRRLDAHGIPWEIVPGVPAFAAAAAALGRELTLPGVAQSVVLTRMPGRASPMPPGEDLAAFAATGATLVLHLAVNHLARIVRILTPVLGADAPVAVVHRASWPDQRILRGTLADIRAKVKAAGITRTALIVVGRVLAAEDFPDSRLYHPDHHHVLRPRKGRR